MHQLIIVGLGPGHIDYMTLEALRVLKQARCVTLRTDKHPVVKTLADQGMVYESFDALYDQSEAFEAVYQGITDAIIDQLNHHDVVYAVPGNPFVAEQTVQLLLEAIPKDHVKIVYGTSFLDVVMTQLQIDPVQGLRVVDCLRLDEASTNNDDTLVCIQCYDPIVASELKIWLTKSYHDDHEVIVIKGAGIPELESITKMPLYQLDRHPDFDHLTSVVVPDVSLTKRASFDGLVRIMKKLRSEEGCPWDREQTHSSLKPYVLEEAFEVAEAIDQEDWFALEEELGDLLLQVVFHAQIGHENGQFAMAEVLDAITDKMISRHPHVFGDARADTSDAVLDRWEAIKREENQHASVHDTMTKFGKSLPALFRSFKVQKKAERSGFDWPDVHPVFAKLHEEIDELHEAIAGGDTSSIQEEVGDLLFTVVNIARKLEVDPEFALHQTTDKFMQRYKAVEREFTGLGQEMVDIDIDELEKAWIRAKKG